MAIVSRGSESSAVLPLYASACQKMSHGCGMRGDVLGHVVVRHAMPVA